MPARTLSPTDLVAGACVLAVGLFAIWEAASYPFGALRQPGPGLFPLMLGILMTALGLAIALEGLLTRRAAAGWERPNFRSILAIPAALGAFAVLVERAGLVPAIFAAVLICSLAEPRLRIPSTALLATGLAIVCVLIFVQGLNLPFRAFRW
ncbi:MAG TPA: tripartite tricarboxylate transporter TctB family protein [Afifellaceae bacterium]|nr:tripartite tricarboxylate transporter TctB family protein [Afifellaceae bacterium]